MTKIKQYRRLVDKRFEGLLSSEEQTQLEILTKELDSGAVADKRRLLHAIERDQNELRTSLQSIISVLANFDR
jgi:hypothetical protein